MASRLSCLALVVAVTATSLGAYVVRKGDTLWDLSGDFMQNPREWPELWEANPQVRNPHKIYPGQKLQVPGEQKTTKSPKSPKSASKNQRDFESRLGILAKGAQRESPLMVAPKADYGSAAQPAPWMNRQVQIQAPVWVLPVSEFKQFADELLTESEAGKLASGQVVQVGHRFETNLGEVEIKPGQFVDLFAHNAPRTKLVRDGKEVELALHRPLGIGEVVSVRKGKMVFKVIALFDVLRTHELRARPSQPKYLTQPKSYTNLDTTDFKNAAKIDAVVNPNGKANNAEWVMIDKGAREGFEPGDAIAVWEGGKDSTAASAPELLALGIVVRSTALGSAVFLRSMNNTKIQPTVNDLVSVYAKARH